MTKKRKHHFVPQFFLKYFSHEEKGKQIGIYNLKSKKFVPSGALKNQAYEKKLYGKNNLVEDGLQDLENKASRILSKIKNSGCLPTLSEEERVILYLFVIFLWARTISGVKHLNELTDKTFKVILKNDPRLKEVKNDFFIGLKEPATTLLRIALEIFPVILDLELKLIYNETDAPFIVSDNPVVKYNQFLEGKDFFGGSTSFGVKGLQIFLPISSNCYLVFFDSQVYKVGAKKKKEIIIKEKNDINQLNTLQIVNAEGNLFFNQKIDKYYIEEIVRKAKRFFRSKTVNVKEFQKSKSSSFIVSSPEDLRTNLKLSFISVQKKARASFSGDQVSLLRNEKLIREASAYWEEKENRE